MRAGKLSPWRRRHGGQAFLGRLSLRPVVSSSRQHRGVLPEFAAACRPSRTFATLIDTYDRKEVGTLPLFDPSDGMVIAEPPGEGDGYWAGGPSAIFDKESGQFFLSYRLRNQLRDFGRAGRGGETVVATGRDGHHFETIWSAHKDAFDALSIEKSCIMLTPQGTFRLYVSYSSRYDFRWRIDMMEADDPARFDPEKRMTVLSPENTPTEGVKDPVIFIAGGVVASVREHGAKAGR